MGRVTSCTQERRLYKLPRSPPLTLPSLKTMHTKRGKDAHLVIRYDRDFLYNSFTDFSPRGKKKEKRK